MSADRVARGRATSAAGRRRASPRSRRTSTTPRVSQPLGRATTARLGRARGARPATACSRLRSRRRPDGAGPPSSPPAPCVARAAVAVVIAARRRIERHDAHASNQEPAVAAPVDGAPARARRARARTGRRSPDRPRRRPQSGSRARRWTGSTAVVFLFNHDGGFLAQRPRHRRVVGAAARRRIAFRRHRPGRGQTSAGIA